MVNYCCVYGCGRNNKIHKHLIFYSVPKDKVRQEQWFRAAGREDLLGRSSYSSIRLCSRHFEPSQIKKKHLAPDAVPSLSLPRFYDTQQNEPVKHGLICDSCADPIVGFRYKCITCPEFDLCQKCEMLEVHPEHFMLRIHRPMKFTTAENLIKKWQDLIGFDKNQYEDDGCDDDHGSLSSDDEPITKYTRESEDRVDLPDDVKARIRKEIERVLKLRSESNTSDKTIKDTYKKRSAESCKPSKRLKTNNSNPIEEGPGDSDDPDQVPELAFADVDDVKPEKVNNCNEMCVF